jgi:hypothetical protein
MRIQNLKAAPAGDTGDAQPGASEMTVPVRIDVPDDRQSLEVAFLKARIQHLELVLETARWLMGSNHERLLRQLHQVPRELVELSNRLRRFDVQATW